MALADDIIVAIGLEPASRLVSAYCGARLYVPIAPTEQHPLTMLLGATAAGLLAAKFGGEAIDIPVRLARHLRALEMYREGCSLREIARELHCSVRWARSLVRDVSAQKAGVGASRGLRGC